MRKAMAMEKAMAKEITKAMERIIAKSTAKAIAKAGRAPPGLGAAERHRFRTAKDMALESAFLALQTLPKPVCGSVVP